VMGLPAWGASDAGAQQLGNDCDARSFRVIQSRQMAVGQRVTWISMPDVVCPAGVEIFADSAVVWEATGRTEFIGGFRYRDVERDLQSVNADYFQREGRLLAMGRVRIRSLDDEMEVRGDTVRLFEGQGGAGDDRLLATGHPAYARVRPAGASGGSEPTAPYEVTGLSLRFEGERFLYADREVEVIRYPLHARTQALSFDRTSGTLLLAGDARVESGDMQFEGSTINLTLPDDQLTSMIIRENSHLTSPDLDLTGKEIQIQFEDGGIRHLLAINHLTDPAGAVDAPQAQGGVGGDGAETVSERDAPRPRALADDFLLTADSIEVQAPGGVLETVLAYGRARGESRQPTAAEDRSGSEGIAAAVDTTVMGDGLEMLDRVLGRDWIEGDTIVASFIPAGTAQGEDPEVDEAPGYVLDRLVAVGGARTLYRSPPDTVPADSAAQSLSSSEWAISYLVADQIILTLLEGQVRHVLAEGAVAGLQLEPEEEPAEADETLAPTVDP